MRDFRGHYYEYDLAVAEAACHAGLAPTILANRNLTPLPFPEYITVVPAFSEVTYADLSLERWKVLGGKLERMALTFWRRTERIPVSHRRSSDDLVSDRPAGQEPARFNIPVRGLGRVVAVARMASALLRRWFASATGTGLNDGFGAISSTGGPSFTTDLLEALDRQAVSPDDLVLVPSIGLRELAQLTAFTVDADVSSLPALHVILRRDYREERWAFAHGHTIRSSLRVFKEYEEAGGHVFFYTDTDRLTDQYNDLELVSFTTLPIPFRHALIADPSMDQPLSRRPVALYLGEGRLEKGFQHLPDIIASFAVNDPTAPQFVIQISGDSGSQSKGISEALKRLESMPEDQVSLVQGEVSADDYYRLLAAADIVLIPYDGDTYRYRSSGIFTEAKAAGKVVIVPSGTWMAEHMSADQGTVFETPDEIGQALRLAVDRLEHLTREAMKARTAWRERHNPKALIKCLLERNSASGTPPSQCPSAKQTSGRSTPGL